MKQKENILREASFGKLIINLCVPTVIIMIVMVIYNMADIFFIGKTGDPCKIAAVSLCSPLFSILSGLGTLFGSGGCTAVSLALGRQEKDRIRKITALCFCGSVLIGVLFSGAVLLFLNPVCTLIGSDETTLAYTREYLRVIAIGASFILFSNVFTNLIRADGAAKESLIANMAGTLTNIILDPIFILGFHGGVTGAAIASVLGNVASAVYLFWYVSRKCPEYSLKLRDVSLEKEIRIPVVTLGIPLAVSTILMSVSSMISNNLMMGYGSVAVAVQGVAGRVGMLISMTQMGICMGMQPAISYNFAAENRKRTRMIIKNTGILTVCIGLLLSGVCFIFRHAILNLFIANAQVQEIGGIMVVASALIGPFFGIYQLCTTYLQATGNAGFATLASILNKGVIFLPVLFIMNCVFQMYGVIFTGAVTDVISVFAVFYLCRLSLRKDTSKQSLISGEKLSMSV